VQYDMYTAIDIYIKRLHCIVFTSDNIYLRLYALLSLCKRKKEKEKEKEKKREKEMGRRGKESKRQADILNIQPYRVAKTNRMP